MAEDPAAARTSLGPVILFLQDIDRFGSYEREMRPAVVVQVHNDLRLSALLSGVICCMPFFAEAACRPSAGTIFFSSSRNLLKREIEIKTPSCILHKTGYQEGVYHAVPPLVRRSNYKRKPASESNQHCSTAVTVRIRSGLHEILSAGQL